MGRGSSCRRKAPAARAGRRAATKLRCIYQHTRLGEATGSENQDRASADPVGQPRLTLQVPGAAAASCPADARFDVHAYGSRELGYRFPKVKSLLFPDYDLGNAVAKAPNLYWHGGFKWFASLPLERFDAFLYTGLYDGIPNVLLEAGRTACHRRALIGGIGELIKEATGWPVCNPYDAREYAERLREAMEAPAEAVARADALARLIAQRHSFEAFCRSVSELVTASQGGLPAPLCGSGQQHPFRAPERVQRIAIEIVSSWCWRARSRSSIMMLCWPISFALKWRHSAAPHLGTAGGYLDTAKRSARPRRRPSRSGQASPSALPFSKPNLGLSQTVSGPFREPGRTSGRARGRYAHPIFRSDLGLLAGCDIPKPSHRGAWIPPVKLSSVAV